MKRINYFVGLVTVVLACILTASVTSRLQTPAAAQSAPPERFRLMQGTYSVAVRGDVKDISVFRIDAQTGATWRYVSGMKDSKYFEGWSRIPDQVEVGP
jgi:hypothetical protein